LARADGRRSFRPTRREFSPSTGWSTQATIGNAATGYLITGTTVIRPGPEYAVAVGPGGGSQRLRVAFISSSDWGMHVANCTLGLACTDVAAWKYPPAGWGNTGQQFSPSIAAVTNGTFTSWAVTAMSTETELLPPGHVMSIQGALYEGGGSSFTSKFNGLTGADTPCTDAQYWGDYDSMVGFVRNGVTTFVRGLSDSTYSTTCDPNHPNINVSAATL
jgi:hypothetical protein